MPAGTPSTRARASVGSAMPRPTPQTVSTKSSTSALSRAPTRPSPHVPGKKLEPENVWPALRSATRAPASAADTAATTPAIPAPMTATS